MLESSDIEWLSSPDEGWATVALPSAIIEDNFVTGDKSGRRLDVCYFRHTAEGSLRAKVVLGPAAQGPPGHAHGGSMAALLDDAMGGAAWLNEHMVVAAELTAKFRKMLPLGTRCIIEARVASIDGRKVRTTGVLRDESGQVFAEGEALFITLDPQKFDMLATEASRIVAALKVSK